MSESNKKIIPISRRKPTQQRRRQPQVGKTGAKKPDRQKPSPPKETGIVVSNNGKTRPIIPGEKQRPSRVILPTPLRPTPQVSRQKPNTTVNGRVRTVRIEKSDVPKRNSKRTRLKPMAKTMLYAVRLLIIGVGIGAIVGTVLSVLDPANRINTTASVSSTNQVPKPPQDHISNIVMSQEIPDLKGSIQGVTSASTDLTTGVFLLDLDNGNYVDINANSSFSAASTIKVPILIALFQDVDRGKIGLNEMLTLEKDMIGSGSGNMQYQQPGTKYTVLDVATKMITISDNTATNMLIAKLGGKEILNQRFSSWGLTNTNIRNPLPDLDGTNTTTPKELGVLISLVSQGKLVSMRSRDLILDIMSRTERDNLIPAGLGKDAKAYHKTGDIGTVLADTGLIDIPNGKRYIASVMVQRPRNDPRAATLIQKISNTAYQYFSQTQIIPTNPSNNNNLPATNNLPPTNYPPSNQPNYPPSNQTPIQPTGINPHSGMVNNIPGGNYPAPMITPQYYPQTYR